MSVVLSTSASALAHVVSSASKLYRVLDASDMLTTTVVRYLPTLPPFVPEEQDKNARHGRKRNVHVQTNPPRLVPTYMMDPLSIGSFICDAHTGSFYSAKVGSADEDLFFTVTVGSRKLFFASPAEYLMHFGRTPNEVDSRVVQNWQTKCTRRIDERSKQEQQFLERQQNALREWKRVHPDVGFKDVFTTV
jgi:hypothetical protein